MMRTVARWIWTGIAGLGLATHPLCGIRAITIDPAPPRRTK